MTQIQGTKGYESGVERFATATESISFEVLHQEFLAFLPEQKSMILDIGAGIGRDAYVLAEKGHEVIAAEPLAAFREKG
ncbi:MAG: class I SAM-dependent methyltransferase, partial [Bacteroidota bacterium]